MEFDAPPVTSGRWLIIWKTWTWQEVKMLFREPVAILFSLLFPLIIYVFIGIPYGHDEVSEGVRFIDVMFPSLILTVVANLLVMGLPIYMSELRSKGADRRYAIVPLPPAILAAAMLGATLILVLAGSLIVSFAVGIRDGLQPAILDPVFTLLLLGTVAWLGAFGFFLGTLPVSSRATQALSAAVFFIMFFGSGAAVPLDGLPEILRGVLDWNPLKQWLDVLTKVYTSEPATATQWLRLWIAAPFAAACAFTGLKLWKRRV